MIGNIIELKEADGTTVKALVYSYVNKEVVLRTWKNEGKHISKEYLDTCKVVVNNQLAMCRASNIRLIPIEMWKGKDSCVIEVVNPYYNDFKKYGLLAETINGVVSAMNAISMANGVQRVYTLEIKKETTDTGQYVGGVYMYLTKVDLNETSLLFSRVCSFTDMTDYLKNTAWVNKAFNDILIDALTLLAVYTENELEKKVQNNTKVKGLN